LLFNKFFPIVDICLSCEDIARQISAMVRRWRIFGEILRPVFSESRVRHISDLHSKFTLRPHHVWKYGRHPVCDLVGRSAPYCEDMWRGKMTKKERR